MKKSCRKFSGKIILFDDLSPDEKVIVQSHLKECRDCQAYFDNVKTIMRSLKSTNHLRDEQLTRFIIFENFPGESDFDGERLSINKAAEIRSHLQGCRSCLEKYEGMRNEFKELESFINESIAVDLPTDKNVVRKLVSTVKTKFGGLTKNWKGLLPPTREKLVYITAAGIAVLLVMILFLPILTNSDSMYHKLAKLENTEITFLTRSSGVDNLKFGISEFNNGNYSLAVEELESFILGHPDDPNREIAEYVCGLAHLFSADKGLDEHIGMEAHENIEKGIQHLQTVLLISENKRLQEDCDWYIGKAYLMKREAPTALGYFEKVQNSKGRKSQKAKEILLELRSSQISSK